MTSKKIKWFIGRTFSRVDKVYITTEFNPFCCTDICFDTKFEAITYIHKHANSRFKGCISDFIMG